MASVLVVRGVPESERTQAKQAVQLLHQKPLNWFIRRCLRQLITEAQQQRGDLFKSPSPLSALRPIDRVIYLLLTAEGRRTVEDLIPETGLARATVKASLARLERAGLICSLDQGGETEVARGARRKIYLSLAEQ